jgi:hypothetical protein
LQKYRRGLLQTFYVNILPTPNGNLPLPIGIGNLPKPVGNLPMPIGNLPALTGSLPMPIVNLPILSNDYLKNHKKGMFNLISVKFKV